MITGATMVTSCSFTKGLLELKDGRTFTLKPGMSYQVSDSGDRPTTVRGRAPILARSLRRRLTQGVNLC